MGNKAVGLINKKVVLKPKTFTQYLKIKVIPKFSLLYQYMPRNTSKRKFHAYCIGAPRSGTQSLARACEDFYSSLHEPADYTTIGLILRWLNGEITDRSMVQFLMARDKYLNLEMEATHFLHHVIHLLVKCFPDAKFILNIRDPYTWLNSEINQNIASSGMSYWDVLHKYRYSRYGFSFSPEEEPLSLFKGVYSIDSYCSYWRDHNEFVINSVPADKLLILKTNSLSSQISALSNFLDIDPDNVNLTKTHSNKNKNKKINIFTLIDKEYIDEKVKKYCNTLLSDFFPDIQSVDDIL